jgi:ubiquinone/menaquinone biosynthesis C-methylase UbiE
MAESGYQKGIRESVPAAPVASSEADYLRHVATSGQEYKALSYELLQVAPGMKVLEVGCGIGADLPALAERVGSQGLVVGIESAYDLLEAARATIQGHGNIVVARGEVEALGSLGGEGHFQRVRADWALQRMVHPLQAVAEMWRVLEPGGLLLLIEPDWKALAVFPASPRGGDDDQTLQAVLVWKQMQMPHALMGRQLKGVVQQLGYRERMEIQVGTMLLESWPEADRILRLSSAAQAFSAAYPAWGREVAGWLEAMKKAAAHGEFLAALPLFFARAWKEFYLPLSGRPRSGTGKLPVMPQGGSHD